METILIYLLKSSGLMIVFYLAYFLLLRKETFFTSNRWFLLAGLFTSVLLPFLFFTKIVWVAPTSNEMVQVPIQTILKKETFEINWFLIIGGAYAVGLLVFLIKFAIDFFSLAKVLKGKQIQHQADFKFVDIKQNTAPFSYFNYIVYNSDLYSTSELENILEHEKVHSAQNHTVDVLIARLFCIIFWYNPFMWWYKKAILQNLEFIADCEATKNIADKKAYQITLLKITTHENCVAITNHFYQSLIKKRIVMLNKNQSKKWNSWKYALVIPALIGFVFLFQIKIIAQEKVSTNVISKQNSNQKAMLVIDKNTTDSSLKQFIIDMKNNDGVTLKISQVKRNSNGEITGIKVSFKDNEGNSGVNQVNSDKPIQPITFAKNTDKDGKTLIGFFTPNHIDKEIRIVSVSGEDVIATQNLQTPQNTQTPQQIITISKSNPIVYINGNRTDENINEIDPEIIASVDVLKGESALKHNKDGVNGVILITTKNITAIPNPPTPPNAPNLIIKAPKIPKPPKAPKGTPSENNEVWKSYEGQMKEYELQIKKMQPDMKNYEESMKVYEEKMKVYEEQMEDYSKKIEELYSK